MSFSFSYCIRSSSMRAYETTTSLPVVKQSSVLTRIFSQSWKSIKKKRENYFLMGCAQLFPKVLLRLLNNFLQRTNRGCGAGSAQSTSAHFWANSMTFCRSRFLWALIYFEAVYVSAQSIPVTDTAHPPLSLRESACDWKCERVKSELLHRNA